jgi:hypothetical protein
MNKYLDNNMDIDKINQLYYQNRKMLNEQNDSPTFFARVDLEVEHHNKPEKYDYPTFQEVDVSYKIYFDFVKSGIRSISVYDVKVSSFDIYDEVDEYAINVDFQGKEIEAEVYSDIVPIKITLPLVPSAFRLVVDGTTPIAEESALIFD